MAGVNMVSFNGDGKVKYMAKFFIDNFPVDYSTFIKSVNHKIKFDN